MDSTQTLFTLLAMIQHRGADAMDTKWFSFEHEGQTGKARFLLADSQNVWNGKDSIMCDHYRLDLNLSNNSGKFLEKSDYWLLRYCRDKFSTVFGIFHAHVIFKKFCCNGKK